MSAYDRLHPRLKHAIFHDLGWRQLRPVQELAIEAILDGDNAVVLAPTAGGKTEASFFPVLSHILSADLPPVAVLYVCPIRALLNNQEPRVKKYARMVGLDAFKWHGDVGQADRKRFLAEPTHVLMTTPESLEVMLIHRGAEIQELFAGLSTVIIDEVHAFAADDRGAHLVSILERLSRFCDRDLQRIGLSATVGNPDEIGRWLGGSSQRPYRRVDPPRPPAPREITIELLDQEEEGPLLAAAVGIARGKKSLMFANTRGGVEEMAASLQRTGMDAFVHHGSVSREDRERAEAKFQTGSNAAIVATSTLELGIDVGDLDRVIQLDAPTTVSSLMQRMGRTGRREGTTANCHFLCRSPETMLLAIGLCRLAEQGWVEDVEPDYEASHVLAHQIMALSLQQLGISRHRVLPWIADASPFRGLDDTDLQALVDTMLARDILYDSEGRLSLGREGEKLYGGRNFLELYAVFSTPPIFRVQHGRREIGTLDMKFLRELESHPGPSLFRLAGRPWFVRSIDWSRAVCFVEPARGGAIPKWAGSGGYLSYEVCQSMKAALMERDRYPWLGESAWQELRALRQGYRNVLASNASVIETSPEAVTWHTFAGGAINALLVRALEEAGAGDWRGGNLMVSTKNPEAMATAPRLIRRLRDTDLHAVAQRAAADAPRGGLSKFQPCLPAELEASLMVRRVYDVEGAEAFVRGKVRQVVAAE